MILRPTSDDIKVICFYLGKVIIGIALLMTVPILVSVLFKEWDAMFDFLIGTTASLSFGFLAMRLFYTKEDLGWMQGMIVASLSWLIAMPLSAIPLSLSGHFLSFFDTCFETMSGFTTTGLTLIQDIDHFSYAHNMWREFIMYIGGQGMVVVALVFLIKTSGMFSMYVGEAKEEKILPNVIHTARFIWLVSIVYLILGTIALMAVGVFEGLPFGRAFFHGISLFMGAWSTGGFVTHSQSILYYHSPIIEIVTMVIFILGTLNFKLHHAIWTGDKKEIFKNIESVTMFVTVLVTFSICALGLIRMNVYPEAISLFRKGFYQLISGHTTTGFQTIYSRQFLLEWNGLAMTAVITAMFLGGCACSTVGGIKALRIGLIFKALQHDIKKIMFPDSAIVVQKFHHIKDIILEDRLARSALLITLCYLLLYLGGAVIGMLLGYSPLEALFESTSAAANVGLSCGITSASMPALLKITYIFQMWIGRLEFMSVFALLGFVVAILKGK